jgi:hypothetical protein
MKVSSEILKSASSRYFNNLSEVESDLNISIEPMNYNESRRMIIDNRVICLYRLESGKIEAFSYEFKSINNQ